MADPESTDACPTSLTTDQPELLPCPFCGQAPVRNGRMGGGGVICRGDNLVVGMVHRVQAYGADQAEADAAWNTRLTPTTPTLGDMVMREVLTLFLARMDKFGEWDDGCFYYSGKAASELQEPIRKAREVLSAAPASPIPTSANGAGERERAAPINVRGLVSKALWDHQCSNRPDLRERLVKDIHAALSPALDNTAVEGRKEVNTILARLLQQLQPDCPDMAERIIRGNEACTDIIAALTAETEKAR